MINRTCAAWFVLEPDSMKELMCVLVQNNLRDVRYEVRCEACSSIPLLFEAYDFAADNVFGRILKKTFISYPHNLCVCFLLSLFDGVNGCAAMT